MTVHYRDPRATLHHGDCLDVLATLPACSVDAVVTDPPYDLTNRTPDVLGCIRCRRTLSGRDGEPDACPRCGGELTRQRSAQGKGFMGKAWDSTGIAFDPDTWRAIGRVLKPGGHLLAFGGTRTWHRQACAIEDAGLVIRDSVAWIHAQGFPKGIDVGRAIDAAAGAERADVYDDRTPVTTNTVGAGRGRGVIERRPATDDAAAWDGWKTALKPAFEPIVLARKPLAGTVAANVLAHGTGALNVDACRVPMDDADRARIEAMGGYGRADWIQPAPAVALKGKADGSLRQVDVQPHAAGRYPPNVLLDDATAAELDAQAGDDHPAPAPSVMRRGATTGRSIGGADTYGTADPHESIVGYGDDGGPSRYFPRFRYEAKASGAERTRYGGVAHSTVKPLDLMRWLVRLVTPPGGTVLDPFAGSGTTGEAAVREGFRAVLIEAEADYLPLIVHRLTRHADPVAHLRHRAAGGEDVDLGLFGLLEET